MQELTTLQSYKLGKLRVVINHNNNYLSCPIQSQQQSSVSGEPNLLTLEAKIIIKEPLNHCLKPKAELLKVWIKNKCITINLLTRQGAYSFSSMNYYSFLQVLPGGFNDRFALCIEDVHMAHRATIIIFKLYLHQDGKALSQLLNNAEIWVEFGSTNKQQSIKFEVAALSLLALNSGQFHFPNSKFENKFEFKDGKASMPLGVILSPNQVYEIFDMTETSLPAIESLISTLQAHISPAFEKESKLYICHDMKGGYIEDTNFDCNTVENNKNENLEYRSLHLEQAEIFNYFSHYNITIPPLHWRLACRNASTKCLGTFILQHPVYAESTLVSQEFALLLVAIARKCQFDGYLINIETKINNIAAFKKWLAFLTNKMHQHIPNSVIIWYDSISQKDGVIRYQNSLSAENEEFYQITDGLFTNYWWNDDLLKKSVELKGGNPKRLYIGNDCFGRNTYGGGMFNIYKAANKILEFKNDLSIALFAPGFSYQNNGQHNRRIFHLNELALYKGIKSQVIPIDKWKYITKQEGWKKQGDWTATSFELCQRSALFNFPPLEKGSVVNVHFMFEVMGTPPIHDSPYKIVIQVIDQSNNVVYQNEAHNFINYRKTPQNPQVQVYQANVSEELVGNKPYGIKVIEMAKCREYWAGHFGPRFKNQSLYVLVYQKERHWINRIPVSQVRIGKPYHSLCNAATGDHFHYLGTKMQPKYSYLADYDLPHTHIINHPFETELNYQHSFIGGTSLTIKREAVKLLKVIIPKGLDLAQEYFIQVAVKDTPGVQLNFKYISKNEQERIFAAQLIKVEEMNEWKRCTFKLATTLKEVKADIRSIIDIISQRQPYILGEINLIQKRAQLKPTLLCTIESSRDFVPTSAYYLNVTLQSQSHNRLLILIESFAGFAYFQAGKASLANIRIEKCDSFNVKVIDIDSSIQHIVLRDYLIEAAQIASLIMNGSLKI